MREFKEIREVRFQIGEVFGTPIYHTHKLAIYKTLNDELDIRPRGGYKEPQKRAQKHTNIRSFRKTDKQFRQD